MRTYTLKGGLIASLVVLIAACVTPSSTVVKSWTEMEGKTPPAAAKKPVEAARPEPKPQPPPPEKKAEPKPDPKPAAVQASSLQGARISASRGAEGGFVVLWPRIIPSKDADSRRPLANKLQIHLRSAATHVAGGRKVEVRPEPERVCPRAGCKATAAGILLLHHSRGCAAVGMVTPPGPNTTRLIPLAGKITLKSESIPFRDFPESQVIVHDFVPCDSLMTDIAKNTAKFEDLLRKVGGGS